MIRGKLEYPNGKASLLRLRTHTPAPQLLPDQRIQLRALRHLLAKLLGQLLHLVGKGFVVILHLFGTAIAARRQHMAVFGDFRQFHAAAEAG